MAMAKKRKTQKRTVQPRAVSSDVKRAIAAIVLLLLALLSVLGFLGGGALLGAWTNIALAKLFGVGKWLMPPLFVLAAITLLRRKERTVFYVGNIVGFTVMAMALLALLHIFVDDAQMRDIAAAGRGGGYVGYGIAVAFKKLTGMIVGVAALAAIVVASILVTFNLSVAPLIERAHERARAAAAATRDALRRRDDTDIDDAASGAEEGDDVDDAVWEDDASDGAHEDPDVNIKHVRFGDIAQPEEDGDGAASAAGSAPSSRDSAPQEGMSQESAQQQERVPQRGAQRTSARGVWKVPPLTLLESAGNDKAAGGDTAHNQRVIQETYANFGIALEPDEIVIGPTVTQYAFRPPAGVKLSRITALASDVALALAAHPIRIEAPIPGKSLIGIEVPNAKTASVRMRDIVRSRDFPYKTPGLKMALGKDVSGKNVIVDLAKMPHVLVAGATGAGKSVAVNAMIISLLCQNTPQDLRLILVDPKRVELSLYNGIPHLLSDVIVENGKVLNALKWAVGEMERRYALLQSAGTRELASYNARVAEGALDPQEHTHLPAIVIVIDEMADLMASHGKEVEGVIVRIAQMARAVGIHLILSTQRPSVEVLTGLIKANVPTRIALRVATQVDSRTILDRPGAETLLGRGDMLYLSADTPQPKRIQSVFISDDEVRGIVDFLRKQEWPDDAEDGLEEAVESAQTSGTGHTLDFASEETIGGASQESDDPLYAEAKALVIKTRKASTSYLQRRFRIGYSRAARLIDALEDNGVIAPADGAKPRQVLIAADAADDAPTVDTDQVPMVGEKDHA